MDSYKETFETWNKVASLYQDKFMHLDLYNETYDLVLKALTQENAGILEIGCGPGNITKYLLSKRPDLKIFGIDIAPKMVALAETNNPTARFEVMDSRQIGKLNTKYDGIIAGFCLPYLSDDDCQKLITDSIQLLNENGLLYLSFVEGNPVNSGFQVSSGGDRVYFYYHNLQELIQLLKKNQFEEIQVIKVSYLKSEKDKDLHTIVIARKISKNEDGAN
jgi:predicted TPR repeat methyltransferase